MKGYCQDFIKHAHRHTDTRTHFESMGPLVGLSWDVYLCTVVTGKSKYCMQPMPVVQSNAQGNSDNLK